MKRTAQNVPDLDELRGLGQYPGAMAVAVDFDQDGQRMTALPRERRDGMRHLQAVEHDLQVGAAGAQVEHVRQFSFRDAYCVEKVDDPVRKEIFHLLQRGHGRRHCRQMLRQS
jgi:hypothetical protein